MRIFTPYRTLRALVLCTSTLVAFLITPRVSATTVSYSGSCARTTDVTQWSPQKGPIARFVADTFANSSRTGIWIGLGRYGTSFWSAEGGEPNDACDDCRSLSLVETRANGARTLHPVLASKDYARLGTDPVARKEHILAALWKLASTTWPADKLAQSYTLTVDKPTTNAPDADPSFAVNVAAKGIDLRFNLDASTSMCWCMYEWKAHEMKHK